MLNENFPKSNGPVLRKQVTITADPKQGTNTKISEAISRVDAALDAASTRLLTIPSSDQIYEEAKNTTGEIISQPLGDVHTADSAPPPLRLAPVPVRGNRSSMLGALDSLANAVNNPDFGLTRNQVLYRDNPQIAIIKGNTACIPSRYILGQAEQSGIFENNDPWSVNPLKLFKKAVGEVFEAQSKVYHLDHNADLLIGIYIDTGEYAGSLYPDGEFATRQMWSGSHDFATTAPISGDQAELALAVYDLIGSVAALAALRGGLSLSLRSGGARASAAGKASGLSAVPENIMLSKSRFGHTFTTHGQDATEFLTRRAAGSGMPQGQFLDDQVAASFIQDNLGRLGNEPVSLPVPNGFPARVIMPDGQFVSPTSIRLVPGGKGVKTAYPEP